MDKEQLKKITQSKKGQSLIELLIAIGLAAILLPALLTGFVASREGRAQESERLQATALLRESTEAMRNIRNQGWSNIPVDGTYHPTISGSVWTLASGTENIDNFFRDILIESVNRDSNGNIVSSGGILDPSIKKFTYTISWSLPNSGQLQTTEYLTRYLNNATLINTTRADFNRGTLVNTVTTNTNGGTVELDANSGSSTFIDDFTNSADYGFDSNKIEVTGGYAQLKSTNSSVNGSTSNTGFDSNITGWTFSRYGQNVSQLGSWQSSGGNPGGYARINFPSERNKTAGGYFRQAFTTTVNNPTAMLSFNWRVTNYQATPDSFHLYAWIDTGSGNPGTVVWDSGNIAGTTAWSGLVNVDVGSYINNAGTYYLKFGAYVDYPSNNRGPYTVGFDNVSVSWSGNSGSYPLDSPTITENSSFSAPSITSWDSFSTTEITNGGVIMYQLSDDDGATWQYHNGGNPTNWAVATQPTDYNDALTIDQQISGFSITNNKIKVRAFLISNGSQLVQLDNIIIGYTGSSGINMGNFTSETMDAGGNVGFNNIVWTESNTANTTTEFQIAVNTDDSTWNFVGPDNTASTYFTGGSGILPLEQVFGRYFRYKTFFESTNDDIPSVSDVTINYSP